MVKLAATAIAGLIIGCGAAIFALRNEVVSLPRAWHVVKLQDAARSKTSKDDPGCFPHNVVVSDTARQTVRENAPSVTKELPAESAAILKNLVLEDGPVPELGQRAIRSAYLLIALQQYQACLAKSETGCDAGSASHLFGDKLAFSAKLEVDAAFKIGRWTEHLKADLQRSEFCVHR